MDEHARAAFDSAAEAAKQVITLATGILALEVTFANDILGTMTSMARVILGASWVLFLLSVAAGGCTLLALTGSLGQASPPAAQAINSPNITRPAIVQVICFLLGLALTIWFGLLVPGATR
jgi:hypothetical protein